MKKKENLLGEKGPAFMSFGRTEIGTPQVEEKMGKNPWIEYGKKNDYPQELIRLAQNASSMHGRLLKQKADMIAGNGFKPYAELEQFFANEFSKEHLDEISFKCAYDLGLINAYYLKVIWNKQGKIAQIDHMPVEKVRIEKPCEDTETEEIRGFYVSSDWVNHMKKKSEDIPKHFVAFEEKLQKSDPEQLLYVRGYTLGMDYYTLPTYSTVLNYIKLDWEISTYHLKNVQNGFMPGMVIINKMGIPDAPQREEIYNELKARYAGAENAGDFLMVFSEGGEKTPEFVPVQLNASDQRFKDLSAEIDNKVMFAHQFTSALAGIETSGKLGSKNELSEQLEMFQLTVIRPLQKIVEKGFQKLAEINGLPADKIELKEYKMFKDSVSSAMDTLNSLNPAILDKILESVTSQQLIEMLGLKLSADAAGETPVVEADINEIN